jgi:threonine synthase
MRARASYACLKLARSHGYRNLVIASCGNFGASFVHLARNFDIETHVYIPEGYQTQRLWEIENKGGIIYRVPGTYEETVEFSSEEAERLGWFNVNPGVKSNTRIFMKANASISYEIHERLGYAPDVVAVPVGNGTTIAGIHLGFKRLCDDSETDKVPVMVAASTLG